MSIGDDETEGGVLTRTDVVSMRGSTGGAALDRDGSIRAKIQSTKAIFISQMAHLYIELHRPGRALRGISNPPCLYRHYVDVIISSATA
jgi:hypothetical protein